MAIDYQWSNLLLVFHLIFFEAGVVQSSSILYTVLRFPITVEGCCIELN